MDKKSVYLLWGFVLFAVAVSYWGYRVFFVERNFIVQSITTCDPQAESCFVWCEEGKCEEDYYKKIIKNARNIPVCNGAIEECEPLICEPEETSCEIISCTSESVEEGERCTNPLDFVVGTEGTESTSTEEAI